MSISLETAALWLVIINIVSLTLMGVDKYRAMYRLWRIPERTIFLSALLGGTPGVIMGMELFRHKTRHNSFRLGMPALLLVQLAGLLLGSRLLSQFPYQRIVDPATRAQTAQMLMNLFK